MSLEVIQKALDRFPGTGFTNAYGLIETNSTIALLGPDDHREALASDDPKVRARLTSLGQPLPTVEIEIRDEEGKPLGTGRLSRTICRVERPTIRSRSCGALLQD